VAVAADEKLLLIQVEAVEQLGELTGRFLRLNLEARGPQGDPDLIGCRRCGPLRVAVNATRATSRKNGRASACPAASSAGA